MKEALYMIPVNDAFDKHCECPVCTMYEEIEKDAINFTLGPSYMEDDIRMETDKTGFCEKHIRLMYKHQNRLGLGLILNTHFNKVIKDFEKLSKSTPKAPSFFKRNTSPDKLMEYMDNLNNSCYVCNRINGVFDRYIATIFHLYKTDGDFVSKLKNSKGFCFAHYTLLYKNAGNYLGGRDYEDFIRMLNDVFLSNLKRVNDDVEWFTDKFDYTNKDAPWKNSKDALPRALIKTNSVSYNEENS